MLGQTKFNYFLCRLFEGTWGGTPSLGTWPITSLRLALSWGHIDASTWDQHFGSNRLIDPKKLWTIRPLAKTQRICRYQRIRNEHECRLAVANGRSVFAAFEITQQWESTKTGRIQLDLPNDEYIGAHGVTIVLRSEDDSELIFENHNRDQNWGDHGYGYLPRGFFDRYLVDSWLIIYQDQLKHTYDFPDAPLQLRIYGGDHVVNGFSYGYHLVDTRTNDVVAWLMANVIGSTIHIEDLYVDEHYRRHGFARTLLDYCLDGLNQGAAHDVCLWLPWGDHYSSNISIVIDLLSKHYGLNLQSSGVRWSPFKFTADTAEPEALNLQWSPERPALATVEDQTTHVDSLDWSEEHNSRRIALIEKKYGPGLSADEIIELSQLQEQLSSFQNKHFPLPFDFIRRDR